jgi:hypothetical protein
MTGRPLALGERPKDVTGDLSWFDGALCLHHGAEASLLHLADTD